MGRTQTIWKKSNLEPRKQALFRNTSGFVYVPMRAITTYGFVNEASQADFDIDASLGRLYLVYNIDDFIS